LQLETWRVRPIKIFRVGREAETRARVVAGKLERGGRKGAPKCGGKGKTLGKTGLRTVSKTNWENHSAVWASEFEPDTRKTSLET